MAALNIQDAGESRGRLFPLVYGETYHDLPGFLERLVSEPQARLGEGQPQKPVLRVPPPLPANIAHYLTCLAGETATLRLLGMGRSLQVELPIDEAYVPLRTTLARSMEERPTERFKDGHAEYEEGVDLDEVFRKADALELRGVVLLGEPGSGKTTGAGGSLRPAAGRRSVTGASRRSGTTAWASASRGQFPP